MKTDSIGGRKFIAYCACMAGLGIMFITTVLVGLLTADLIQTFLTTLIVIQGIFFGGNLAEKYILKGGKENGIKKTGTEVS